MTIETQKNFLGKTQTIIMAEVQSERWLSWLRLMLGGAYAVSMIFGLLLEKTNVAALGIQAISIIALAAYSCYYLFNYSRKLVQGYFVYVLIFLDVTVVTAILWSHALSDTSGVFVTSAVYGAYFIIITFTALHHRISLSVFCGLLSALAYSVLYFSYSPVGAGFSVLMGDYAIRILLLLTAAGLGAVVSRNNSKTMLQVVSSEIRYHNLVHRLPEMLFTIDRHGNFLWSNMASHAILGIPAKVLAGRSIKSFMVHPDALKLDRGGIKGTFEVHDFANTRKFVDCIIQESDDETDAATFEGIMADVTDRELAISQREEMVNRLFQYQKMESLGTLASGMAHDFNNILQTVYDLTAIVQRDSAEAETRKRMELINETLADARFLISELLALGRKKPLDYKAVNLTSFLETIVPQLGNQLGENCRVSFEKSDETLCVQADPDYLKRVFQNLFGNARDAMPEGGNITVSISCFRANEPEPGSIIIRIADTGTGIPPELTEKIFDPFFTTKKPGKGTGLGLALVRRIIMLHNGNVSVEKTDSNGTVFRIEIPESEAGLADNDTKSLLSNRLPSTILLLDDDPKIRDVLKFFLKDFKYPVCEAQNQEEACSALKKHQKNCNVVIMDWRLGNEDPHQVIAELRKIKSDLIVIVVSGYSPVQKSIEALHIQKWFTKPYDKNQLDIEIQRALHQRPEVVAPPARKG